eukprot:scaffold54412_cov55-Phaeocystis_antarctica.AAC.4
MATAHAATRPTLSGGASSHAPELGVELGLGLGLGLGLELGLDHSLLLLLLLARTTLRVEGLHARYGAVTP